MVKKALKIKDEPKHKARLAKSMKKKRIVRKFKDKTFAQLTDSDKDELLKALAIGFGFIKEDA